MRFLDHTDTRQDSSELVICYSQRPLPIQYTTNITFIPSVGFEPAISEITRPQSYSYFGARNDTTQHSGQIPNKEVEINHFIAYGSGYIETDPTDVWSPNNSRISDPTEEVCRSEILAIYLLQVPYDFGIRTVDKTYLIELVRERHLLGTKETEITTTEASR